MGFQYRGEMSSGSMFNNKSSSGSGNPFGSGWDPLENFGGSSAYPVGLENHQGLIHHYQSGSGIGDLVPKLGSFGSGSFSEMVNPFANNLNPECGASSSPNSRDKRRAPHSQFKPITVPFYCQKKKRKKKNRILILFECVNLTKCVCCRMVKEKKETMGLVIPQRKMRRNRKLNMIRE